MKMPKLLLLGALLAAGTASAQEPSALSCNDFRPTPEAIERYPNLVGACEAIVERDGELFGLFRAVVRRSGPSRVTLHLPATGNTFSVRTVGAGNVIGDLGRKVRPSDLNRGDEIRIYLPVAQFAEPDIQEVAFVTEEDVIVQVEVEREPMLPTTASPWPAVALGGLLLIGTGYLLRRRRIRIDASLAVLLGLGLMVSAPSAKADGHTETIDSPQINQYHDFPSAAVSR